MATEQNELPFFDGTLGLGQSYDAFAGRNDLRQLFASLTWDRQGGRRQDYILVLEGRPSFGKSSMKDWCLGETKKKAPHGEVVTCSLDLKIKEGQDIKSHFYKSLFDEMYDNFAAKVKEKNRRWKFLQARRVFRKLVEKMSKGPEHSYNPFRGVEFRSLTSEMYFDFVKDLNRAAKRPPKAYVIIIDNVSHKQSGIRLCADLLLDLRTFSQAGKWPDDFPNFVLVLLPLPGWAKVKTEAAEDGSTYEGIAIDRRITDRGDGQWETLKALSQIELNEFVQRRCKKTGWEYDEKAFIPALYHMSGGVPLLMQQIGVVACRACVHRTSKRLMAKDVMAAIRSPELEKHVKTTVTSALGYNAENYLETVEDRKTLPLFYRCYPSDKIDWGKGIHSAVTGRTKKEWFDAVLAPTDKSAGFVNSFEKLWKGFVEHGVLVHNDGKYRFHAEVIRRYFNTFDPQ